MDPIYSRVNKSIDLWRVWLCQFRKFSQNHQDYDGPTHPSGRKFLSNSGYCRHLDLTVIGILRRQTSFPDTLSFTRVSDTSLDDHCSRQNKLPIHTILLLNAVRCSISNSFAISCVSIVVSGHPYSVKEQEVRTMALFRSFTR